MQHRFVIGCNFQALKVAHKTDFCYELKIFPQKIWSEIGGLQTDTCTKFYKIVVKFFGSREILKQTCLSQLRTYKLNNDPVKNYPNNNRAMQTMKCKTS